MLEGDNAVYEAPDPSKTVDGNFHLRGPFVDGFLHHHNNRDFDGCKGISVEVML